MALLFPKAKTRVQTLIQRVEQHEAEGLAVATALGDAIKARKDALTHIYSELTEISKLGDRIGIQID